jgi:hypothetical protein
MRSSPQPPIRAIRLAETKDACWTFDARGTPIFVLLDDRLSITQISAFYMLRQSGTVKGGW